MSEALNLDRFDGPRPDRMDEGPAPDVGLRQIAPLGVPQETLQPIPTGEPIFEHVDPRTLLVEETYQRDLSPKSLKLIEKIATEWDWRKFKPPVVAFAEGGLRIIDGQHTAMGAASRPDILTIPVMVVEAAELQARAMAFIGHNRDRLAVTAPQLHHAAVAAGDDDAVTIEQVCARAGVTVLRFSPGHGAFKPGETLAVTTIASLIDRRGAMRARIVLQTLAEARCAPITTSQIKAVELLLHDPEFSEITGDAITSAIMAMGAGAAEQEAKVFAAAHSVPQWRALGIIFFRRAKRGRRRAD